MQICIRRGAKQIGGTAVEFIASTGERMIVDIGQPLDCDCPSPELLPDIMGLTQKSDDINLMQERGVKMVDIHTSGHADIASLQKFARAIKAKKIVPIHTFYPERFVELFDGVEIHDDNSTFQVN